MNFHIRMLGTAVRTGCRKGNKSRMRVFRLSLSSPSVSVNSLAQLVSLTAVFVLEEKGLRMWLLKGSRSGFLLGEMIEKIRQAPCRGMNYAL